MSKLGTATWLGALAAKAIVTGLIVWNYADSRGDTDMLIEGIRSLPGLLAAFLPTPGGEGV